jgi:exodeoxyribonuclease-3
VKFISWNVNGIRAAVKKGMAEFVSACDADVICLQETRALLDQIPDRFPDYTLHLYPAEKKGYSGTAMLSRHEFLNISYGLGKPALDKEGRVITAELPDYYLVTVYTPNSQRELTRLDYRTKTWDKAFRLYLKRLEKRKPVVFCGDLNVAHKPIDLANPTRNRRNAGFTDEERGTFTKLLGAGFIDTFRMFCDEGGHYTWWSNMAQSRQRNVGWRIDYFCTSLSLESRLRKAAILPEVMGSDHCPVVLELD